MNAALALGKAPPARTTEMFAQLIEDPDPRIRLIAARSVLAQDAADAGAVAVVKAGLTDPVLKVRQAVLRPDRIARLRRYGVAGRPERAVGAGRGSEIAGGGRPAGRDAGSGGRRGGPAGSGGAKSRRPDPWGGRYKPEVRAKGSVQTFARASGLWRPACESRGNYFPAPSFFNSTLTNIPGLQLAVWVRQVDLDAECAGGRVDGPGEPRHLALEFRLPQSRDVDHRRLADGDLRVLCSSTSKAT